MNKRERRMEPETGFLAVIFSRLQGPRCQPKPLAQGARFPLRARLALKRSVTKMDAKKAATRAGCRLLGNRQVAGYEIGSKPGACTISDAL